MIRSLRSRRAAAKRRTEKIYEVDAKTGAALLGRAGWHFNGCNWDAPGEWGMSADFKGALRCIGHRLKKRGI
jgi:hypothetical protein